MCWLMNICASYQFPWYPSIFCVHFCCCSRSLFGKGHCQVPCVSVSVSAFIWRLQGSNPWYSGCSWMSIPLFLWKITAFKPSSLMLARVLASAPPSMGNPSSCVMLRSFLLKNLEGYGLKPSEPQFFLGNVGCSSHCKVSVLIQLVMDGFPKVSFMTRGSWGSQSSSPGPSESQGWISQVLSLHAFMYVNVCYPCLV